MNKNQNKNKKKQKRNKTLLPLMLVPPLMGGTLAVSIILIQNKKTNPIVSEYFEIEGETLKGWKPGLTEEQKKKACEGGVLKLPAVKVIDANAFNTEQGRGAPFATVIEINKTTTKIDERAFYGNSATTVTFTGEGDDHLVEIDDSAFAFCTNLISFKLPSTMFTNSSIIKDSAFLGCTSLAVLDCTAYDGANQISPAWEFGAFAATSATGSVLFAGDVSTEPAKISNFAYLWSRLVYGGIQPAWDECWTSSTAKWAKQIKAVPKEYLIIESGELKGANERIWPTSETNFNAVIAPTTITSLSSTINEFFTARTSISTWEFASSGLTAIPDNAFKNLSSTTPTVYLPDSIATIGASSFESCKWNINFNTFDNITSIGASAFKASTITSFKFPTTLATVGASAFENCTNLKELDFTGWTTAPTWNTNDIFKGTGSTSEYDNYVVKIATKTNVIDQWELKESHKTYLNTKGITIDTKTGNTWSFNPESAVTYDQIFDIESGVLKGWAKNSAGTELTVEQVATLFSEFATPVTTLTIPSTVTSIAANAFYNGTTTKIPSCITKIVIDDACTTINASAFAGATTVTEVVIPAATATIGDSAFNGCTALATIDLSAWTACPTWAGNTIFTNCAATGVVKNQKITNQVDQWRFNNSVRTLLSGKGVTPWSSSAWHFDNEDTATLLKVESNVVVGWSSGATTALTDAEKLQLANDKNGRPVIIIPKEATSIAANTFINASTYASTIPSTLPTVEFESGSQCASIGEKAFYKAPIATLDMTNATNLTSIGAHAFSGATISTLTALPASLTSIGAGAFFQTSITSLKMPVFTNGITFGTGAFANNASLTEIDLTDYTALPTNWTDATGSLFDNIKSSGTIKVKTAISGTILAFMSQHSNTIAYYDTWTVSAS